MGVFVRWDDGVRRARGLQRKLEGEIGMKKNNCVRLRRLPAILVASIALVLALGISGCGTSASGGPAKKAESQKMTLVHKGKLTVVSDLANPPFDYMEGQTKKGFEVELMQELAKKMGLECEYLNPMKFDSIIPTIKQGGKADVSIGAITITDDRKKEIDFSTPYLDSNQSIVVKKGSAATTQDQLNAKGMQIAVQSGTTGESWAQENLPKATVVPLDDIIQAMTGVQTGLYNACVADLPVTSYEIKQAYSDLQIPEGGEIPTGEQYGIVVSKKNPGLTKAINKALKELKSDGTMDSLEKKWFGTTI